MKKEEKIQIIKWYIKSKMVLAEEIDIDSINDLKQFEEIIRTNKNIFGETSKRCNQCTSDGKDFCKRCANCTEWHWDANIPDDECADNYKFGYQYWKRFYDMEKQD